MVRFDSYRTPRKIPISQLWSIAADSLTVPFLRMSSIIMKVFLGYLMLLGLGSLLCTSAKNPGDIARLEAALFQNYDRELLPSYDKATEISLGMALNKIRALDLFQGTIQMNVWMMLSWVDPRLMWNPEQFGNITKLRVPSTEIWMPDVTLYNSNSPSEILVPDVLAVVFSDGMVSYIPSMQLDASCSMDLKDYPYDSHECSLKWGSWAYDGTMITLSISSESEGMDVSSVEEHPIWDIINTKATKHSITYACCPESYEDVTFSIVVRRQETHGRIASSVVITWIILIVFLIRPSSARDRIFFAGFVFVALVVLSAALSAEIPAYSVTRLGRFLIGGMLIVAIVSVVNGFICRFYPREKPGELMEGDGSQSRATVVIDIGAFLATAIVLGVSTGALFV